MLNIIKKNVERKVERINGKINIQDITEYGNKKVEFVLTTEEYMASLTVIDDCTFDFMVIEIDTEKVLTTITENCSDVEGLCNKINDALEKFSQMRKLHN